ncbi:hypothetical protein SAMN06297129_0323 [Pseudooceanicola antarcticus]|uniref:DUF2125 domain-containing protein n=1 Tax=Pseudooceanicola antarcticus TaxID=1247613 RepID=A0A285HP48_9RHOB|nr:DUF2125 domain-containing protein [Pseudooceanicola antarcticus]PJE27718.1 DUF2125 domain-containing protein [Pseudooceanicola antarcticus]SNY37509.1 hypothetical protein SAMN06297129_0323 [Pseudooceanicola antarcticus]
MPAQFSSRISRKTLSRQGISALAFWAVTAPAAFALSPEDVLDLMTDQSMTMATELDIDSHKEGDTLVIDRIVSTMVQEIADEEITSTTTMTGYRLEPRGDEVVMRFDPALTITSRSEFDGEVTEMVMTATAPDLEYVFSGERDDMRAVVSDGTLVLSIDRIDAPDEAPLEDLAEVTFSGLNGDSRIVSGDLNRVEGTGSVDTISFTLDMLAPEEDSEGPVRITATGNISDVAMNGTLALPEGQDLETVAFDELLRSGYNLAMHAQYGAGAMLMDVEGPDPLHYEETVAAGAVDLSISAEGLDSQVVASDLAMSVSAPMIPPGAGATIGQVGFGLTMPLTVTPEEQPLGFKLNLQDVALPEQLWALFDPAGKLSRDPMTISLDLGAMGRMTSDFSELEEMDGDEAPGEISSLSLNSLLVKLGGAMISANGSFDIDNSAKSRINPDMPKFTGQVDATAQGVLGLVQTLAEMGLIPPQQAMTVPMMAGMFTRQLSGPDDLASTIEVTEDEQVLVNGQMMMP